MKVKIDDIVLPGDIINENCFKLEEKFKIILGPGLKKIGKDVFISKPGILRKRKQNIFWVDSYQKRYVPTKGDSVIGVVVNKSTEMLKLDIGTSEYASLSFLAFEGASKKYKPDVLVGDVIYGRLLAAGCDVEPELVCIDSNLKQGRYGILKEGFLFTCSLSLVYKLLNPDFPYIRLLGKEFKCEITVGMNGKVWVNARNCQETLAVVNTILDAEFLSEQEMKTKFKSLMHCLKENLVIDEPDEESKKMETTETTENTSEAPDKT